MTLALRNFWERKLFQNAGGQDYPGRPLEIVCSMKIEICNLLYINKKSLFCVLTRDFQNPQRVAAIYLKKAEMNAYFRSIMNATESDSENRSPTSLDTIQIGTKGETIKLPTKKVTLSINFKIIFNIILAVSKGNLINILKTCQKA